LNDRSTHTGLRTCAIGELQRDIHSLNRRFVLLFAVRTSSLWQWFTPALCKQYWHNYYHS